MNWQKILNPKAHDLTTSERRLRQTALAGALLAALGILVYTSVRLSEPVVVSKPSPAFTEDFTLRADSFDREVFVAKYDRRLKDLEARWAAFEDGQEKLMAAVDTLARRAEEAPEPTVLAGGTPVETTTTKPVPSDAERRLAGDLKPELPPAPYAPYPPPGADDAAAAFRTGADAWARDAFARPGPTAAPTLSVVTFTKKTPTPENRAPTVADAVLENRPVLNPDDPIAANRALGATAREYVTAGSIVRGTLLTGVYAPTGGAGAGTPVPILIDVAREALLPNGYRADLTDCRMTGNATGDLSSSAFSCASSVWPAWEKRARPSTSASVATSRDPTARWGFAAISSPARARRSPEPCRSGFSLGSGRPWPSARRKRPPMRPARSRPSTRTP